MQETSYPSFVKDRIRSVSSAHSATKLVPKD